MVPGALSIANYLTNKDINMATKPRNETTSARVATAASKVLRDPTSTRAERSAAASALTQRVRPQGKK